MTKQKSLKVRKQPERHYEMMYSHRLSALRAFLCATNPERARYRKSDISYAKYHAEELASGIASEGPKWLEAVNVRLDPVERDAQRLLFASELGTLNEWQYASRCVSQLSSMLIELMHVTNRGDAVFPEMFETLGILAYVQAQISQTLETALQDWA